MATAKKTAPENATKPAAKAAPKKVAAKKKAPAKAASKDVNDTAAVNAYLQALDHPLKAEAAQVRKIIKGSHPLLNERIKWAAPSFFLDADLVTFNMRAQGYILLVFHHPAIVKIKSPILTGDYKDRRLVQLHNKKEVKEYEKELVRIMNELIEHIQ